MTNWLRYSVRLILFLLLQHFIGYRIPPLQETFSVIFYYLFLLWLPFSISRAGLIVLSFVTGLMMDAFTRTPGMHAAACVCIGYVRPFLIHFLMPQREVEFNYREPSAVSLGLVPYITYISLLTILHHLFLFSIQAFQFGSGWYLFVKTLGSTVVSLLIIAIIELIFPRKQKFLTNT